MCTGCEPDDECIKDMNTYAHTCKYITDINTYTIRSSLVVNKVQDIEDMNSYLHMYKYITYIHTYM